MGTQSVPVDMLLTTGDSLLGRELLADQRLTIDFPKGEVTIKKSKQ